MVCGCRGREVHGAAWRYRLVRGARCCEGVGSARLRREGRVVVSGAIWRLNARCCDDVEGAEGAWQYGGAHLALFGAC